MLKVQTGADEGAIWLYLNHRYKMNCCQPFFSLGYKKNETTAEKLRWPETSGRKEDNSLSADDEKDRAAIIDMSQKPNIHM